MEAEIEPYPMHILRALSDVLFRLDATELASR